MSGFSGKSVPANVIARARRGDRRAHEAIFKEFAAPCYSLAARMTGSTASADDILQDSFVEVMRAIVQFRGDASLATWIRRIVVTKSLMHMRAAWSRRMTLFRDLGEGEAEPELESVRDDAAQTLDLDRALGRLSDVSRMVVVLHDIEGYTHAEIARLLGKTPSFSKSQLSRAHRKLRAWLNTDFEQHDDYRTVQS